MVKFYFWTIEQSELNWILWYSFLTICGGLIGWLFKAGHRSAPLARANYAALSLTALFLATCCQAIFVFAAHSMAYGVLPLIYGVGFGSFVLYGYLYYALSYRRGQDIAPGNINTAIAFIPFGNLYFLFAPKDKVQPDSLGQRSAGDKLAVGAMVAWSIIMFGGTKVAEKQIEFIEAPELTPTETRKFYAAYLDGMGFDAYYWFISQEDLSALPFEMDQGLWLTDIAIDGTKITYVHEVKAGFVLTEEALTENDAWVCENVAFAAPLAHGGTIVHTYYETDDTFILEYPLQEGDCRLQI